MHIGCLHKLAVVWFPSFLACFLAHCFFYMDIHLFSVLFCSMSLVIETQIPRILLRSSLSVGSCAAQIAIAATDWIGSFVLWKCAIVITVRCRSLVNLLFCFLRRCWSWFPSIFSAFSVFFFPQWSPFNGGTVVVFIWRRSHTILVRSIAFAKMRTI